ncbi:MAG: formylglycine-generating enzyme family protein [Desulfobacteraceae bacterium]|nr:formylglycine-generating enzyme family protein [Desulfobacteraceae bacterium]
MIGRKRYLVFILFVLSMFILMSGISSAWEEVENVRMEQVGDDVHIYYDLRGDADKYNVTVRGSSDGGRNYRLPMKTVSGDVGKDVLPGSGKRIIWKALKDAGELEGDEFVFEVEAVSGPGKEFVNSIGMKFVLIPAGSFMMGSPSSEPERDSDENQHRVTLTKGFYMGVTEVTQGQWREIMGSNPSNFKGDNLPVEQVSWNDCQEFIRKLNLQEGGNKYRLPTEAEWEYACRAGSTSRFCFGDSDGSLEQYAWYNSNSSNKTHPVAQKKPNEWGLYDMHGNVWEWCQDWFGDYPSGHVADPDGPSSGSFRVRRGGSWFSYAGVCRSASRHDGTPGGRGGHLGFRLARTP